MSPAQCRAARERLRWTLEELATAAGVPPAVVADYEDRGDVTNSLLVDRVRVVLEEAGIGFPFALSGGRRQSAGITYSPRDKRETH